MPASPAVHARRPLPYPSSRRPFLTHPGLKNRLVTAQIPKGQNGRRVLARPGSTEYCLRLPDGKKVRAPHGFTAGSETSKSNTNHGLSYFRDNTNTTQCHYLRYNLIWLRLRRERNFSRHLPVPQNPRSECGRVLPASACDRRSRGSGSRHRPNTLPRLSPHLLARPRVTGLGISPKPTHSFIY